MSHIWVDGGYVGRLVTWANKDLSVTLQVVKRTDKTSGFLVLPRRWVVERTFGWITKHRRCVRDYETLPDHHEAMAGRCASGRNAVADGPKRPFTNSSGKSNASVSPVVTDVSDPPDCGGEG